LKLIIFNGQWAEGAGFIKAREKSKEPPTLLAALWLLQVKSLLKIMSFRGTLFSLMRAFCRRQASQTGGCPSFLLFEMEKCLISRIL